jgi:hypothetical protein
MLADVLNYLDEVWLNKYKEMFVSGSIDISTLDNELQIELRAHIQI